MISFLVNPLLNSLPDLSILAVVWAVQVAGLFWLLRAYPASRSWLLAGGVASGVFLIFGFLLGFGRVAHLFPLPWAVWTRGSAMIWALVSVAWVAEWFAVRLLTRPWAVPASAGHSPARRGFLLAAGMAVAVAPLTAVSYGVYIERRRIGVREQNIRVPGLAADLDGLRLVQLTDIHLSPFLSERDLAYAVAMANETRPHVALVTGDLITAVRDPVDACLDQLARLRADAGVFGCMGNHEMFTNLEDHVAERGAQLGLRFLRGQSTLLQFGAAKMNLAGVDYQRFRHPYLTGAEKMVEPGVFNVLLSHNPDVFPVAARQGYQLTLAGHTHGGQIRVEILHQDLNIARFFTPYVDGLYSERASSIWVSRGIGTIGMPVRLGAPPEVALLKLCRI